MSRSPKQAPSGLALLGLGTLATTVVALLVALYQATRRYGDVLLRLEAAEAANPGQAGEAAQLPLDPRKALFEYGAEPGSVGMNFELPALDGRRHTLAEYKGRRVLLIFVDPDCPYSRQLLAALPALPAATHESGPRLVIVSTGDPQQNQELMQRLDSHWTVLLQQRNEVELLYFVRATPTAFLLDAEGATEIGRIEGARAILGAALALLSTGEVPDREVTPVDRLPAPSLVPLRGGEMLPPLDLPALDGGRITGEQLAGRQALVVIFDPLCAPCVELLPFLEKTQALEEGPRIVMITRREPELTRALAAKQGLRFPIAVQADWDYSQRLGVPAAPVACLVGPDGRLEADPAVGRHAVETLLRQLARRNERRLVSLSSLLRP